MDCMQGNGNPVCGLFSDCPDHHNFFGIDENIGPVAVSLKRERIVSESGAPTTSGKHQQTVDSSVAGGGGLAFQYRIIVRTSEVGIIYWLQLLSTLKYTDLPFLPLD